MRVVVDSWAWVEKKHLTPYQLEILRRDLTVLPQKAGNFGPEEEPKPIHLYVETPSHFGMAREYFLSRIKPHHQVEFSVSDGHKWPAPASFEGTLEPAQKQAFDSVLRDLRGGKLGGVLRCPTAFGKCLGVGTPVLLYDGRVLPVDLIRPGDLLMGPDSTPRRVLSTTRGTGPLFDIKPEKGTSWVCNDVHVLTLVHTETGRISDISLPDYLSLPDRLNYELFHVAVEFPIKSALPLDPYLLGVWFACGSCVQFTTSYPEIGGFITEWSLKQGFSIKINLIDKNSSKYQIVISSELWELFRGIIGQDFNIPREYCTASIRDRSAFLAGFLDAFAGLRVEPPAYRLDLHRADYAEVLVFIARSLGYQASVTPEDSMWHVSIEDPCAGLPLRVPCKKFRTFCKSKISTRFTVTALPEGPFAGFTLDGDGRFLLGDCTVTHNTVLACALITELKVPTLVVVHREPLVDQWMERIHQFIPQARVGIAQQDQCDFRDKHIVIGMVHSLAGREYLRDFYEWPGLLLVDETHRIGAGTWSSVPPKFPARYRLGLSATPYRADKADNVFFYHIGNIIFSASRLRLKPKIRRVWTTFQMVKTDRFNPGLLSRPILLRFLCSSAKRNCQIVDELIQAVAAGRKVLVLSERLQHLHKLEELLRAHSDSPPSIGYYVGKRSKEELKEAAEAVVVFATSQFAREGIDIPALDTLFLTTPLADIIQPAGRILREHPTKKDPVIVDFRDDLVSYCEALGHRRDRQYDSLT